MEQNKNAAIVAYLTIIGSVIAIFMNNENKSWSINLFMRFVYPHKYSI